MKIESNMKPTQMFNIYDIINEHCTVYLYDLDNIQEEIRQIPEIEENKATEQTVYIYNMYKIEVWYRDNLQEDIEQNYDIWLQGAKDKEYNDLAKEARDKRDKLLQETDWTQLLDNTLSNELQTQYREYRQALRDIPQQEGFPYNITWPEKPIEKKEEN